MAGTKKPRRAYRGGKSLVSSASYALSNEARTELALRDRRAIDAVLSGQGEIDHLAAVEAIAVQQVHILRLAAATPAGHQVEPEAVAGMLADLERRIVPAIADISERWREMRRVSADTDAERAALADLADVAEATAGALPRRMLLQGMRVALDQPEIAVEVPA